MRPNFLFFICYHQVIDHIEYETCKTLSPMPKKSTCCVCSIFFKNKDMKFINKAPILLDPEWLRHHLQNFLRRW